MAPAPGSPASGADAPTRRVLLLGATGSIGRQTVEVVAHLAAIARMQGRAAPLEIVGLAAGRNARALFDLAGRLGVRDLAIAREPNEATPAPGSRLRTGPDAAERLVREVEADIIVGAMVGAAGLPATLAALELGRDVALANKETLVAAGALVVGAAQRSGARLLPVDSEHSAAWQCLAGSVCPPCTLGPEVRRLVLTASGGPFRETPLDAMRAATPEQALDHPTWSMGPKVTVDSASLMNKALEVIEAHWLFGLEAERIGVLVHPGSIVHALVEYTDGSVVAQLGAPDMRTPIQHALTWPARWPGLAPAPDLAALGSLPFEEADEERFPALGLAREVIRLGGVAGAALNGANEAAVEAFLAGRIPFGRIVELAALALGEVAGDRPRGPVGSLTEAMEADRAARAVVAAQLGAGRARAPHAPASKGR
jgi:1-deoxy-D-xylulose-5-phosphate reductoisomerase